MSGRGRALLPAALLAVCIHLGLLFGLSAGKPQMLPQQVENRSVEIDLHAAAPVPAPQAVPPPPPVPEPEIVPAPQPVPAAPVTPKPQPTPRPQPVPKPQPTPAPAPVPAPAAVAALATPQAPAALSPPPAPPGPTSDAKAVRNPPPRYPELARRRGQEGSVLLRVAVDAEGAIAQISIEQSSGHNLLDQAARNAVRQWRFSPALLAGRPVAGELLVPVEFRLR